MLSFLELQFLLENYQDKLAQRGVSQDIIDYIDSIKSNSERGKAISKAMSNPRLSLDDIRGPQSLSDILKADDRAKWTHIMNADPTSDKSYFNIIAMWAYRIDSDGSKKSGRISIRLPEDIVRVHEVLEHYNKNKNRYKTKYITRYQYFTDLEQEYMEMSEQASKRQEIRDMKMKGAKKIYDKSGKLIYKITTKEAACYYGAGTKWCTAAKDPYNYAESYIEDSGALYILIDTKRNRKWQSDGWFDQIMDERDVPVDAGTKQEFIELAAEANVPEAIIAVYEEYDMIRYIRPGRNYEQKLLDIAKSKKDAHDAARIAKVIFEARVRAGRTAVPISFWDQWEEIILKSKYTAEAYFLSYIENPSKQLEKTLKSWYDPKLMTDYCARISEINGTSYRVSDFEPVIISKGTGLDMFRYALKCVQGRWKEAEKNLKKTRRMWNRYLIEVIKGPLPFDIEDILATDPESMYEYSIEIAKGRVPEYEKVIDKNINSYLERNRESVFAITKYLIKYKVKIDSYLKWLTINSNSFGIIDYVIDVYGTKMPSNIEDRIFEDPFNGLKYITNILTKPLTEKQETDYFSRLLDSYVLKRVWKEYVIRFKRELPLKVLERQFDRQQGYIDRLPLALEYSMEISKKRFPIEEVHRSLTNMYYDYKKMFGDK